MERLTFVCCDGEMVSADAGIFMFSEIIMKMLTSGKAVITMTHIKASTIQKMIEWVLHHRDDPTFILEDGTISKWSWDFLNLETNLLLDLMEVASYFNIKGLKFAIRKICENMIF